MSSKKKLYSIYEIESIIELSNVTIYRYINEFKIKPYYKTKKGITQEKPNNNRVCKMLLNEKQIKKLKEYKEIKASKKRQYNLRRAKDANLNNIAKGHKEKIKRQNKKANEYINAYMQTSAFNFLSRSFTTGI